MSPVHRQLVSRIAAALGGLLASVSVALAQAPPGDTALRNEFRQAYEEARLKLRLDAAADSEALKAYVLYPYLEAARLEAAMLDASSVVGSADAYVAAFLARHDGDPVARALKRTWLGQLAERAAWEAFLDAYDPELADHRLRCQYFAARIAAEQLSGLAPEISALWLTPRQLPPECEAVFKWLRNEGLLDDELVAERVTRLIENGQTGFARVIARRLPPELAQPLEAWIEFAAEPRAAIDAWLAAPSPADERALLDGWSRLSRNAPVDALARAETFFAALSRQGYERSDYARALALGLAWDRRPESLDWFAPVAELDDYTLGWLTRAALWMGRWPLVADAIGAMSRDERTSSAWRYWAARATEALAGRREARAAYVAVLPDDNYYAAMAAARLGRRAAPHPMPLPRDDATIAEIARRLEPLRARELAAVGLRSEATLEWQHGYAALDEAERLQSIHLAAELGFYDIAVATATRHEVFGDYALLYPRPFEPIVERAAKARDVDVNLLFALIRQESLFRSDAASASGALGLMQLVPSTASRAAREAALPEPARQDLFDAATNVALGSAHLETLLADFDGRLPVALAAYNAGPAAAARWLPDAELDADIWIENIPYNETRAYVRRVLWHTVVFDWLKTDRSVDLRAWRGTVSRSREPG